MQKYVDDLLLSRNFIIIILVLATLLAVYCLIDVWKHEFKGNEKMFWLVLILLAPVFGAVVYLGFGRKNKLEK